MFCKLCSLPGVTACHAPLILISLWLNNLFTIKHLSSLRCETLYRLCNGNQKKSNCFYISYLCPSFVYFDVPASVEVMQQSNFLLKGKKK